jgi:hypothetical protein
MYPSLLFTATPSDVNPVTFSFDRLYTSSLFESIADFTFRLEVNRMRLTEEEVFQNKPANTCLNAPQADPEQSYCQNLD